LDSRSNAAPELRHELKLVADEEAWSEVRMALRLDRAGIRPLFAPRIVQSVYLDTPFGKALQENLAGLSGREKIRVRWYGSEVDDVQATLERKVRENSLGWKETVRVPEPLRVCGEERRRFVQALARGLDVAWRARLHGLEPAQWVRYRREYYASADRKVRLTLDRELRFSDQRPLARLRDAAPTPSPRILVLELKCAPEHLDVARDIVHRLPIPLGRCSKFVLAAMRGAGPLPSQYEV
jgi:hypothetical protein